jgi:hypothetical protein
MPQPGPTHDAAAQWQYEGLIFSQPHVETSGLFRLDLCYYIVCPNLGAQTKARDGRPVQVWFDEQSVIGELPIVLVDAPPEGAKRSATAAPMPPPPASG